MRKGSRSVGISNTILSMFPNDECFLTMIRNLRNPSGVGPVPAYLKRQLITRQILLLSLPLWSSLTYELAYSSTQPPFDPVYHAVEERWPGRGRTSGRRVTASGPSMTSSFLYSSTSPSLLALLMWNINVLESYLTLKFLPCPPFPLVPAISIFVSCFTAKPLERVAFLCPTRLTSFHFLISSDVHFDLST